jgi:hypothetical protein
MVARWPAEGVAEIPDGEFKPVHRLWPRTGRLWPVAFAA